MAPLTVVSPTEPATPVSAVSPSGSALVPASAPVNETAKPRASRTVVDSDQSRIETVPGKPGMASIAALMPATV